MPIPLPFNNSAAAVRARYKQAESAPLERLSDRRPEQLIAMRLDLPKGDPRHAVIGPAEHRAFARDWTRRNPLSAVPVLLGGIPAYTVAKAAGMTNARSPASTQEMTEAYKGLGEGLLQGFKHGFGDY